MSIKAINPIEAYDGIGANMPDFVIAAFNELIQQKYRGKSFIIKQEEAITKILFKAKAIKFEITRNEIFDKHYLDIESIYIKEGWIVKFDKPIYCENYEAFYTFKL